MNILNTIYQNVYEWFSSELLSVEGLYQLFVIAAVIFLSFLFAKLIERTYVTFFKNKQESEYTSWKILIMPVLIFILLFISKHFFQRFDLNFRLIDAVAGIAVAFIIIKLLSHIFGKALWLRPLFFLIWFFTFLRILDLQDDLLALLELIQFDLGDTHISLLLVFKGIIVIFIAFGLAFKLADFFQYRIRKIKNLNPSINVLLSKTAKIVLLSIAAILSLNIVGIKLTTFAVLGGAIGVGIGFGLQKIVSNYISGFILLLDKSIKPGDVIEIEDTFGTIRSMSARYITVLTLEGKEHLLPNEDLITNKVVNWSHSNRLIRIEVSVGVSYSTDIPLALKLLKTAAGSVKRSFKRKEPIALITDFGNSSVDLKVNFWIEDPELGIENIASEVRLETWKLFKEYQIEIPFPQQDIYVKSLPKPHI